jgi:hypothetical protein
MSCSCVICGECNGSGFHRVDDWTQPEGYDLETCEECRGSGICELCEECREGFGDLIG